MQTGMVLKQAKCLHCGRCLRACKAGALSVSADRTALVRDRSKCVECFRCGDVCPTHAVGVYGQVMTVEEVMREIRKDTLFYFNSGGGVTLSGGDILLQADFAAALLKECKRDWHPHHGGARFIWLLRSRGKACAASGCLFCGCQAHGQRSAQALDGR